MSVVIRVDEEVFARVQQHRDELAAELHEDVSMSEALADLLREHGVTVKA